MDEARAAFHNLLYVEIIHAEQGKDPILDDNRNMPQKEAVAAIQGPRPIQPAPAIEAVPAIRGPLPIQPAPAIEAAPAPPIQRARAREDARGRVAVRGKGAHRGRGGDPGRRNYQNSIDDNLEDENIENGIALNFTRGAFRARREG